MALKFATATHHLSWSTVRWSGCQRLKQNALSSSLSGVPSATARGQCAKLRAQSANATYMERTARTMKCTRTSVILQNSGRRGCPAPSGLVNSVLYLNQQMSHSHIHRVSTNTNTSGIIAQSIVHETFWELLRMLCA